MSGTPQLALNDGAVANYTGGSGTATLSFNYVVTAGQNTLDLDFASTGALSLQGGGIEDFAGDPANLTLPATGTDGLATRNIAIDSQLPTVTGLTSAFGPTHGGATVTITGTDLGKAKAVLFGKVAAKILSDTATEIVAATPAGKVGTVDVTVVAAGQTSVTLPTDQYTFVAAPRSPRSSLRRDRFPAAPW